MEVNCVSLCVCAYDVCEHLLFCKKKSNVSKAMPVSYSIQFWITGHDRTELTSHGDLAGWSLFLFNCTVLQIPVLCKLQLRSAVSVLDRCGDESSPLRCQHAIM
jgi:hypothetical protein